LQNRKKKLKGSRTSQGGCEAHLGQIPGKGEASSEEDLAWKNTQVRKKKRKLERTSLRENMMAYVGESGAE